MYSQIQKAQAVYLKKKAIKSLETLGVGLLLLSSGY